MESLSGYGSTISAEGNPHPELRLLQSKISEAIPWAFFGRVAQTTQEFHDLVDELNRLADLDIPLTKQLYIDIAALMEAVPKSNKLYSVLKKIKEGSDCIKNDIPNVSTIAYIRMAQLAMPSSFNEASDRRTDILRSGMRTDLMSFERITTENEYLSGIPDYIRHYINTLHISNELQLLQVLDDMIDFKPSLMHLPPQEASDVIESLISVLYPDNHIEGRYIMRALLYNSPPPSLPLPRRHLDKERVKEQFNDRGITTYLRAQMSDAIPNRRVHYVASIAEWIPVEGNIELHQDVTRFLLEDFSNNQQENDIFISEIKPYMEKHSQWLPSFLYSILHNKIPKTDSVDDATIHQVLNEPPFYRLADLLAQNLIFFESALETLLMYQENQPLFEQLLTHKLKSIISGSDQAGSRSFIDQCIQEGSTSTHRFLLKIFDRELSTRCDRIDSSISRHNLRSEASGQPIQSLLVHLYLEMPDQFRSQIGYLLSATPSSQLPSGIYDYFDIDDNKDTNWELSPSYENWNICGDSESLLNESNQNHLLVYVNDAIAVKGKGRLAGLCIQDCIIGDCVFHKGCWYAPIDDTSRETIRNTLRDPSSMKVNITNTKWTFLRSWNDQMSSIPLDEMIDSLKATALVSPSKNLSLIAPESF